LNKVNESKKKKFSFEKNSKKKKSDSFDEVPLADYCDELINSLKMKGLQSKERVIARCPPPRIREMKKPMDEFLHKFA